MLLDQKGGAEKKTERACNGDGQPNIDALIDLISKTKISQNVENNNLQAAASQFSSPGSPPCFGNMTNEQIQNYLIAKFQNIEPVTNGTAESQANNNAVKFSPFYQNRNAFPNVPLVTNNYSQADLVSLLSLEQYKFENLGQAMSVGQSDTSLCSASQATTSKDSSPDGSSDDGVPFIMPLSHNGTLTATGEDGRVRLIVPVSPSGSTSDVPENPAEPKPHGSTLTVPETSVAYAAPITRSTSEKVPNRSEMMTALRAQWTRHTTK